MMRSLFSGVSGLKNHQTRMDVIGNNIANVNTVAFKASRVTFEDILSQTIEGARSPQAGGAGGVNPKQVGLGVRIGSIDTLFTQGGLQTTDNPTDFAIQGDGFFVVSDGRQVYYTRDGAFKLSADGSLVNASGLRVQGWLADANGVIDTTKALQDIFIPVGAQMKPKATENIAFEGNLNANAQENDTWVTSAQVYDSLGNVHTLTVTFTKTANANEWTWEATLDGGGAGGSGTITFGPDGLVASGGTGTATFAIPGANALNLAIDFSALTQFGGNPSAYISFQDGYEAGSLDMVTTDSNGVITGIFTNGQSKPLAQIALATFPNPGGLLKQGGNLYQISNNSGLPSIGPANSGGRGSIAVGALEMSNVDLAQEFTNMIVTQRGFQANSRVITTSDEMLQDLINIKR
ncbi:flagellar hook protein FlgE [Candidatus Caldatribacterium saccharofermentans]|uniref:Flagellar hook protein FlgE n=1 Tax=Candidatus Caldatribacterium saccharofermentans TaxID=1454753 RepID=A0A7V4TGV1_9BACT